ncbi:hypothetical protein Tco_0870959, partial [Tanacetum coccineum]
MGKLMMSSLPKYRTYKTFGFSRFEGVVNPTAFEKELNTICIVERYLAPRLTFLIRFADLTSANKALLNTTFKSHFHSLKPWNNESCILDRVTWISISDSSSDEDDPTYTWNGAKDLTEDNDEDLEEQDEEGWHNVGTDIIASTQSTQPRKGLPHALGTRSKTKQNTFLVGNQIGFKMNGKECDVARILDDGDHNVDP